MSGRPDPSPRGSSQPRFRPREEQLHIGKSLRAQVPRDAHAPWKASSHRRDPIAVLEATNQDHAALVEAVRSGRVMALVEEDRLPGTRLNLDRSYRRFG